MATRLPVVLEEIRVASPCKAGWDNMVGDDRVRFCGKCEKNVYNLSALTRSEAEALVREKEGRMCVHLYRRADGTVLTADCPDGVLRNRWRQRAWAAVSAWAASAAIVLGLVGGRARADLSLKDGKKTSGTARKAPAATPAPKPSPPAKPKKQELDTVDGYIG